jgi:hypothetical protein
MQMSNVISTSTDQPCPVLESQDARLGFGHKVENGTPPYLPMAEARAFSGAFR